MNRFLNYRSLDMNRKSQQFFEKCKGINIGADVEDKALDNIRARVVQFMESPTFLLPERKSLWDTGLTLLRRMRISSMRTKEFTIVTAVLVIFFASSLMAFAERAYPGHPLYGVKVTINETLLGFNAVSSEQRLNWGVRKIERRLDELHYLQDTKAVFENETAVYPSELIDQEVNKVLSLSGSVDPYVAMKEFSQLETYFRAYEEEIYGYPGSDADGMKNEENHDKRPADLLAVYRKKAESVRTELEKTSVEQIVKVDAVVDPFYVAEATSNVKQVEKLISKNRSKISEELHNFFDENLTSIDILIANATTAFHDGNYAASVDLAGRAYRDSQRLRIILEEGLDYHLYLVPEDQTTREHIDDESMMIDTDATDDEEASESEESDDENNDGDDGDTNTNADEPNGSDDDTADLTNEKNEANDTGHDEQPSSESEKQNHHNNNDDLSQDSDVIPVIDDDKNLPVV